MYIFEFLFHKHRAPAILGICIIVSLVLLISPRNSRILVANNLLNAIFLPVERVTHVWDDYIEVRGENRKLKRMVASLMLERERLLQFRDERERLRQLAAFKEEQFFELLPCEVIGRNIDRFQTILIIDKGEADSLRTRMPVLSYQGYVGRIMKVFPNSAWVQLICSRNSPVSCLNKRSRVVGILEWQSGSEFALRNVGAQEDVQKGDTLVTSGFGGVAPKGFPVAVVKAAFPLSDKVNMKVVAESIIKFRSLEEVFVVLDDIPWEKAIIYDSEDARLVRGISRDEP